jgi:beta-lactam-binding protein with PASTA domain
MFDIRFGISVGLLAMLLPAAYAQSGAATKAASVQAAKSGGKYSGKLAAESQLASGAAAGAQPGTQSGTGEIYDNNASSAKKKRIPPSALSQVPPEWKAKVLQIPVPNFAGETLSQVLEQAVSPDGKPLFATIDPKQPGDAVVEENGQTPRAGTMVVPGTQRLLLKVRRPSLPDSKQTVVPPVKGLGPAEVARLLKDARLGARFSGVKEGVAGDPSPPAGTSVDPGTVVYVDFAVPQVVVPPLQGLTFGAATERLAESSLTVGQITGENTEGATVSAQSPPPLTFVNPGSQVELTMVPAPLPQVPAPDVSGKSCAEAAARIVAAGLRPAWKECPRVSALVNRQIPVKDTMVDPLSMVSVFYAPVPVPPLRGLSTKAAVDRLTVAGLEAVVSAPGNPDQAGSVVETQFPEQGILVDVGSGVSIVMKDRQWWERVPVWGWVAIGIAGLAGLLLLIIPSSPPPPPSQPVPASAPPPEITFEVHGATGTVRTGRGAEVRLTVGLRDHSGASRTTVLKQPEVSKTR